MNTIEFFEKGKTDVELQKKFEGVNTPEKFYEIAKENGLTDDFETMKETVKKLIASETSVSEDELDKLNEISGGSDGPSASTKVSVVTLTVGMACLGTGISLAAA